MAIHALHASAPGEPAREVPADGVEALLGQGGFLWVDFQDPTEAETSLLSGIFRFHPLAIEDCVSETNHPKVDDYGEYVYLVVHGVRPTSDRGRLATEEVDFFLGRNYVVTYHPVAVRAIEEVRRRCREVPGSCRSADMVLHAILDRLVDSYVDRIEALEGEVETLERLLFRNAQGGRAALSEIFSLKKEVLQLKRIVNPQREVLNRFARGEFAVVSAQAAPHFRDVFDHVYRVSEMLESFRDVVTSALETYLTVVANRTNEVMKVLTVVATILMTVSFIAGVYGMNFETLPGKELPWGFWACLGVMATSAAAMFTVFRKQRWI